MHWIGMLSHMDSKTSERRARFHNRYVNEIEQKWWEMITKTKSFKMLGHSLNINYAMGPSGSRVILNEMNIEKDLGVYTANDWNRQFIVNKQQPKLWGCCGLGLWYSVYVTIRIVHINIRIFDLPLTVDTILWSKPHPPKKKMTTGYRTASLMALSYNIDDC